MHRHLFISKNAEERKNREIFVEEEVHSLYPRTSHGWYYDDSLQSWTPPVSTDVACWWCCHRFDWSPVLLPTMVDRSRRLFFLFGCFCSYNCAKAFNLLEIRDARTSERNSLLYSLARLDDSIPPERKRRGTFHIRPAPSRWELNLFGGTLSIEDFRSQQIRGNFTSIRPIGLGKILFLPHQVIQFECKEFNSYKSYQESLFRSHPELRPQSTENPLHLSEDYLQRLVFDKPLLAIRGDGEEITGKRKRMKGKETVKDRIERVLCKKPKKTKEEDRKEEKLEMEKFRTFIASVQRSNKNQA